MESKDNAIKSWANKLPFGFKEFVKGMSNENRIAIASVLIEKDELRFSEMQEILNLPKNLLSQHLKTLLRYGIIRRTKSKWEENEKLLKSKYKLNPKYRNLIYANINQLSHPIIKHSDKLIKTLIIPKEKSEDVTFIWDNKRHIIGHITEERTNKKIPVTYTELKDWSSFETIKGGVKWKKTIKR